MQAQDFFKAEPKTLEEIVTVPDLLKETGMIAFKAYSESGSVVFRTLLTHREKINDFFLKSGLDKYRQNVGGLTVYAVTCTTAQTEVLCDAILEPKYVSGIRVANCRNATKLERKLALLAHVDPSEVIDRIFVEIDGMEYFNPKKFSETKVIETYIAALNEVEK